MAATIDEKSDQDQNDEVINILLKARESRGKNLDLSNKILTYVPKLLLSLTHLQYLYLSKNQIQCLPPSFAENLKQLKWLDLRYNNLYELPENISLLTNLKNLLVEGNKIEKLPIKLGLLSNLTGLNLTENPISFPPDDVIKCGTQVVLLFLREQLAIEEKFGSLDIEDERNYASSTDGRNESPINSELDEPETIDRGEVAFPQTIPTISTIKSISHIPKVTSNTPKKTPNTYCKPKSTKKQSDIIKKSAIPKNSVERSVNVVTAENQIMKSLSTGRILAVLKKDKVAPHSRKKRNVLKKDATRPLTGRKRAEDQFVSSSLFTTNLLTTNNLQEIKTKNKFKANPTNVKVGDMVALQVAQEHQIPRQPSIAKVVKRDKNELLVHFYTGSYNSNWWPMMVRSSPYTRTVQINKVQCVFQLADDGHMSDEIIQTLKGL